MTENRNIKILKESFNSVDVPAELDLTIEKAIQKGKKIKRIKTSYKLMASAAVLLLAVFSGYIYGNNFRISNYSKNQSSDKNTIVDYKNNKESLPSVKDLDNLKSLLSKAYTTRQTYNIFGIAESMSSKEAVQNSDAYSTTNIQLSGVDEGDQIKTDGEYIYKLNVSGDKPSVQIIKATPAENMTIINKIDTGKLIPVQIYVSKDHLIVLGNSTKDLQTPPSEGIRQNSSAVIDMKYPYYSDTSIQIYNISDKKNTKLLRDIQIDGSFTTSRLIENNLYFIANKYINKTWLDNPSIQKELLPRYKDSVVGDSFQYLSLEDVKYCSEALEPNYIMVGSINLEKIQDKLNLTSTLGSGRNIFCSADNLYVAGYNHRESDDFKTTIYKFDLNNGIVDFSASGEVSGTILNQFSMDEYNGNLRVTTTSISNSSNSSDQVNNLFILDNTMKIIGKLEGLAKGERIYSTRFMGDRAYMVTFKTTDPLFVIDVKNPKEPKVLGELKIPGFSNYLHPYDENHIIGFGMDTGVINNSNGEIVYQKGMKLAIFEVSDVNNPKQKFATSIGDRGTYSELLHDHKALLFSKDKNLLAFPITVTEQAAGKNNQNGAIGEPNFIGAYIYNVDLTNGFNLKGKLTHMNSFNMKNKDYNWDGTISRVLYIKDTIYTISNSTIKANALNDLKEKGILQLK
jgi:inhibitor of cysteine peptidase